MLKKTKSMGHCRTQKAKKRRINNFLNATQIKKSRMFQLSWNSSRQQI